MAQERQMFNFRGLKGTDTPVKDYGADNNYVVEQGELQPDAAERIASAERGELRAKLAAVLSRGVIQDRLKVDLPDDIYGEWCRNDPLEINRLKTLGFEIDTVYAPARAINTNADGAAVIGDVIFMTCPRIVHDVIEEIRHDDLIKQHTKKRGKVRKYQGDYNKEEEDFVSRTKTDADPSGVHVKAFSESTEEQATFDDVKRALESANKQIKPFD